METLTPSKHILKRNDSRIEKELSLLELTRQRFEPFINELTATGFDFSVKEMQDLLYGSQGGLIAWIKEMTLQHTPQINDLPITKDAKMQMIAIDDYSSLLNVHSKIHQSQRKEIYQMDLKDGELVVSDATRQQITDRHTIYGNDDAMNVLQLCEQIKALCETGKVNPLLHPALIRVDARGDISIHVEGINAALRSR